MSLEQIRILAVMVVCSAWCALFSGDFDPVLFALLLGINVPLLKPLDLERIRSSWVWRFYGVATFAVVVGLLLLRFPITVSVFLLVVFCLVYEIYGERRPRAPARLIPLLCFLIVLYQARIEAGLGLLLGLWLFLWSLVYCLMAFHSARLIGMGFTNQWRHTAWPSLKQSLPVLILGLLVYWVVPRLPGQNLQSIPSLGGDNVVGFSGQVSLNDIRSLKLSRKHILDLKPKTILHSRYLKGAVLDSYENGFWRNTHWAHYYQLPKEGLRYEFREPTGTVYEYEIDQEALLDNPLFFFDTLVGLQGVPQPLQMTGSTDELRVVRPMAIALSYTISATGQPLRLSPQINPKFYLDTPNAPYLRTLSESLTEPEDSPQVRIDKLLRWFHREFRYSLDVNTVGVKDPIEDFLLNTKRGHCELFATSMALLLRVQGVPTRLITGLAVPEPHPSGKFYYITESDAHAWLEVLIDDQWQLVDPTPASPPTQPGFAEIPLAYLNHFWRSNIMAWDYDRQQGTVSAVRNWATSLTANEVLTGLARIMALLVVGIAIHTLVAARRNRQPPLIRSFAHLDRELQNRFGKRSQACPLKKYLGTLPLPSQLQGELLELNDQYSAWRFGRSPDPAVADLLIAQVHAFLKKLKQLPKEVS